MKTRILRVILAAAALTALTINAEAKTFRWASDGDVSSMDPYAREETFLMAFDQNFYEPLIRRDRHMKLEPGLATHWTQIDPTTWRFTLRHGVTFHDGTPFTADDVVFSFDRASHPGSNLAGQLAGVKEVKKIDDYTVDIVTRTPNPILPFSLPPIAIMSQKWCAAHDATRAAEAAKKQENYATRHENGTGPFILKAREPDVRTVLVKNPNWWGLKDEPIDIDEADFMRIANPSTRVAAMLSGELDMLYSVPLQDIPRIERTPHMKIWQTPELRTIFLGFDQSRPQLLESNVKGRNPFQDKRVREAFYEAIDENAIAAKVMDGYAHPTALIVGPGINGYDAALDRRFPYDPARAKKLLAEAGYPGGFEVGFDCPNDRYVNDAQICQAVVAMLAKIGIKADLLAQSRAKFFGKILEPRYDTSFYLLGWTPGTYDALNALQALVQTRAAKVGLFNVGGYSNPKVDALDQQIQSEPDPAKRRALIAEALKIVRDDFAYIPLHQQVVVWASRDNVNLAQTGDNFFQLRFAEMK